VQTQPRPPTTMASSPTAASSTRRIHPEGPREGDPPASDSSWRPHAVHSLRAGALPVPTHETPVVTAPERTMPLPATQPQAEISLGALPWVIPGLGVFLLLVTGVIWTAVL
jgi:hypothetical protein